MIPRYSRPQMAAIWEPENYFRLQLDIEAYACEAQEKLGIIPAGTAKALRERGKFEVERIREIEREVHHETIAFLTNVAEHVGPEARFVHQGMTSSDVLDTCLAVQLTQAADVLLTDLDAVLAALKRRAIEHKYTPMVARSHGVHAEPTTFGLKLAGHYAEFARNRERLVAARKEIATCQISGAVGTFANIDPKVEAYVAKKLGLAPEPVSTQIIPRDRHAAFFMALALIAAAIERFATELRHLQRTELREASEFFAEGQKGSSAMPHKRNPVLSENLTGLSRVIRSAVIPALENVVTWHERDISHSSVERFIAPDATVTLDFALHRLRRRGEALLVGRRQQIRLIHDSPGQGAGPLESKGHRTIFSFLDLEPTGQLLLFVLEEDHARLSGIEVPDDRLVPFQGPRFPLGPTADPIGQRPTKDGREEDAQHEYHAGADMLCRREQD